MDDVLVAACTGAYKDELVTAQPRQRVGGRDDVVEPGRDFDEELVAGFVAERVVDQLEAVEVDRYSATLRLSAKRLRLSASSSVCMKWRRLGSAVRVSVLATRIMARV